MTLLYNLFQYQKKFWLVYVYAQEYTSMHIRTIYIYNRDMHAFTNTCTCMCIYNVLCLFFHMLQSHSAIILQGETRMV